MTEELSECMGQERRHQKHLILMMMMMAVEVDEMYEGWSACVEVRGV